jgi:hypothetical protein
VIHDSNTLYLVCILGSICTFIPVHFLVLEPPKQLYSKGMITELFRTLRKIAKINKTGHTLEAIQAESGIEAIDFEIAKVKLETVTNCKEKLTLVIQN